MQPDFDPRAQAKAALVTFATLILQRDPSVHAVFTDDATLVGSERGGIATGRAQLQSFFKHMFERPTRFSWEWDDIRASGAGELCWFFAEGAVVTTGSEGQGRAPYRLSAVLQRVQGHWMWQQFHGSEPV